MKLEQRYSAGIAITYQGKILLGHTTGRKAYHSYGISKGGIEEGESILDAAIRETEEEFGIKVPKKLIGKNEYTFVVTSRKYKYNKVVYYYILEIQDLSQIGLKTLEVPKSQLQLKEVDRAIFVGYQDAMKLIMQSQAPVISTLLNNGLI
tara:strand:+ start:1338 stop:1787 length:450 start_codon:yes stop_codon:yes gene_type:complete